MLVTKGSMVPGPPEAMTTCTTVNGACDCALVYTNPMLAYDNRTYSTDGNTPASGVIAHDLVATR